MRSSESIRGSEALIERSGRLRWPFVAACLCTVVTFASAFVAIRAGLKAYSPAQLAALRFVVSSLAFGVLAIFRPVRLPAARDWPRVILAGAAGFTVYALLVNSGEVKVSAGMASFVINISPVFTAILAWLTLGERLPAKGWIGLGVCLAGTALLAFGAGSGFAFEPAVLILLAAAVVQAVYFTMQKPLIGRYGAVTTTSWTVWCGTALLLPAVPSALRAASEVALGATLWIVYLAIIPTFIGYAAWAYAVSHAPVGRVTSVLYFVPPTATFIGWVLLREPPTLLGVVGGLVAISGVAIVNVRPGAQASSDTFQAGGGPAGVER